MEEIGKNLATRRLDSRFHYQDLVKKIIADRDVADFIRENGLTSEEIERSISKFHEYINERDKYLAGNPDYIAKGYKPILVKNQGYADVSYEETKELLEFQRQELIRSRLQFINIPASLKEATFSDVALDDARRLSIFEELTTIVANYPNFHKGFYLYGDFGIGKSYLIAALARELSEKKGASTTILHYPSFVVDMKHAIGQGLVKEKVDAVSHAEILMLDDIGAEQHSSWIRDDILQVILQYRMQENLPTFFTSNFSFANLERHFSSGKSGDETWQARRVMERIRYLAREIHLEGENRRYERDH